jgi:predicted enzyme related to lactoylglutathione lyase
LTHLSFRIADLDAVCARIEAAGGGLLPKTRIGRPGAAVRVVMAHDPDGMRLELIEGPGDPNTLPGSPGYLVAD